MFKYLWFADAVGGSRTACDRLPTYSAIYAWFRDLSVSANSPPAAFVSAVMAAIDGRSAPDHTGSVGPMHRVTLESCSSLSESKAIALEELATDLAFRADLAAMIRRATLLQSPLYVGKAANLKQRIEQHLEPSSDLTVRLREAGIDLRTCVLAYAVVDETATIDDREIRLIEDVITRLCRPGFVLRPG